MLMWAGPDSDKLLPQVIDQVVRTCPIDCRRPLYNNIVLSVSQVCICRFHDSTGFQLVVYLTMHLAWFACYLCTPARNGDLCLPFLALQ